MYRNRSGLLVTASGLCQGWQGPPCGIGLWTHLGVVAAHRDSVRKVPERHLHRPAGPHGTRMMRVRVSIM
jgi:hypothetical protein